VHSPLHEFLLLWKESLNSDGHQFHQYQQNEQSLLILTELSADRKTMTYADVIPGPGLGHVRNVAG